MTGIDFVVVHDRDADIAPIKAAGRKGIHDQRPFGELHGGGIVDLRAVEEDFVLAELHIEQREMRAQHIVIQQIGGSRRLRILGGFKPNLKKVLEVWTEEVPEEQQPSPS